MNDNKRTIAEIITFVVIMIVGVALGIYGLVSKIDGFLYLGILLSVFFAAAFIFELVSYLKHKKHNLKNNILGSEINSMTKKYNNIKDFGEVGYVSFVNQGLKFSAEGKFACVKDFNGKSGYHLAFYIEGTKLVSTPKNYDDVLDYESNMFIVEIGYFERKKLTQPENDNGVIINDISSLKGKTIKIMPDNGYTALFETVEWDDFDCGEISFEEWNEKEHIIGFKLLCTFGVNDIIVGKINLLQDND